MVIDAHAHVTAPESLYVYKAGLLSHRGGHGRGSVGATDEDILKALNAPVFGGSSHLEQLKEAGTDMQLISPRVPVRQERSCCGKKEFRSGRKVDEYQLGKARLCAPRTAQETKSSP